MKEPPTYEQAQINALTKELDELKAKLEQAEACAVEMQRIGVMLIEVARSAWCLADNTAAHVEVGESVTHIIEADDFDRLSKALDALDELPDPPNEVSTGPRKAEHALSTSCGKPLLDRVKRLEEALEKLARLGNEPYYGNSIGNDIAKQALETEAK